MCVCMLTHWITLLYSRPLPRGSKCFNMSKNAFEVCASRQRCFYSNNVNGGGINCEMELTPIEKGGVEAKRNRRQPLYSELSANSRKIFQKNI